MLTSIRGTDSRLKIYILDQTSLVDTPSSAVTMPSLPHSTMKSQRTKMTKGGLLNVPKSAGYRERVIIPLIYCGEHDLVIRDVVTQGARDLVLEIQESGANVEYLYLVSSAVLRNASPYFRVLLDPGKFSEGVSFDTKLQLLLENHGDLESVLPEDLPRIKIADFGQIPKKPKLQEAVTLLLCILHDPNRPYGMPSLHCLALISILAVRIFGAFSLLANLAWKFRHVCSALNRGWRC